MRGQSGRGRLGRTRGYGAEARICGNCGAFENWPKIETQDPIQDYIDANSLTDYVRVFFCTCDG